MAKRCIPGITKWSMYAGGTTCPDSVHGYSYAAPDGNYKIDPTCRRGRRSGYVLRFENVRGRAKTPGLHHWLTTAGAPSPSGVWGDRHFRSPAAAATAANKHCALITQGLAGRRSRRRRRQ